MGTAVEAARAAIDELLEREARARDELDTVRKELRELRGILPRVRIRKKPAKGRQMVDALKDAAKSAMAKEKAPF